MGPHSQCLCHLGDSIDTVDRWAKAADGWTGMAEVSYRHEADSSWDGGVTDVIIKHEVGVVLSSMSCRSSNHCSPL